MPRFVLLQHDHPFLHCDLMLETSGALRTWRLLEFPRPAKQIEAEPLGDHRLAYLDYEGPISGGRGEVKRLDRGDYDLLERTETRLTVRLRGERLTGRAMLERDESAARWTFYFAPD